MKVKDLRGEPPGYSQADLYAFLNSTAFDCFLTMYFFQFLSQRKMKILTIKYYLGGGLGDLSPISQIIRRIFDSAPQLRKIKSLLPGYPSSPKPLLGGGARGSSQKPLHHKK